MTDNFNNNPANEHAQDPAETQRIPSVPPVPRPENHSAPTTQFAAVNAGDATAHSHSAQHNGHYQPYASLPPQGNPVTAGTGGEPVADERRKSLMLPIVSTAAISAILASVGTVAVTGAFNDTSTNTPAATTSQQATENGSAGTVAPIANSTNQNPDWEAVTEAVAKTVVAIEVTSNQGGSQGSGVIIDTEGHIITNNHVVEDAQNNEVTVTLDDGRIYTAEITGLDAATDLAVIKIKNPPSDLSSATIADSNTVTVGASVLAMGNPLGLSQTATTGIVSALDRPVSTAQTSDGTLVVTNAIQIDAAINPGNSGGPLFNSKGEVIGITSSIATMSSGYSSSQSGSIGLGFAIPSNLAKNISEQLIENGKAEHAFLGVTMTDGSGTANDETRQGAQVEEVTSDSAAAKAGLQKGDVIVSVDGRTVTGSESLTGFVRERRAGETVALGVIRNGELIELTATLTARTENATTIPEDEQGGSGNDSGGTQEGSQGNGQDDQDNSSRGGQDSFDPSNPPSLEDIWEMFEQFQR
jgi:putative serine protease PepD